MAWDDVVKYWEEMSGLANFLAILVPTVGISGVIYRKVKKHRLYNQFDYSTFLSYVESNNANWTRDNLKTKKIAIVDDNPEHYPIIYLKGSGYNITLYERVSLTDIGYLFNYNLIILDITGIVEEDPKKGGFEVLKRIKEKSPDKLIIGASSKTYDPTLIDFFRKCDSQINTPISPTKLEDVLNKILSKKYSPISIAKEIDTYLSLQKLSNRDREKLLKSAFSFIEAVFDRDKFRKKCMKLSSTVNLYPYYGLVEKLKSHYERNN